MGLNIKLGERRTIDRSTDPMRRDWVGFDPDLSADELFAQNRGDYTLAARAAREEWVTFSFDGTVRFVVEIEGLEKFDPVVEGGPVKKAIIGRVLGRGDALHDALVGTRADAHRNPVTYREIEGVKRVCACGCGAVVTARRIWATGHDQKAVHDRITRGWGDVRKFVRWFDQSEFNTGDDAS